MAELILTQEEKDTIEFLDFGDADLGRFVKYNALKIKKHLNLSSSEAALKAVTLALVMLEWPLESNASEMELETVDCTYKGRHLGDWKISFVKTKEPEEADDKVEWVF